MVTAHGIYSGTGREGNPVVLAIVPSSEPILQIIFIAATIIASYWFVLYTWVLIKDGGSKKYIPAYTKFVAWGSVFACATHIFGISTWLI
jgi:hypothetical protein